MLELSIGKLRGLQQCATAQGALAVLALDHRQGLRKAMSWIMGDLILSGTSVIDLADDDPDQVGALAAQGTGTGVRAVA